MASDGEEVPSSDLESHINGHDGLEFLDDHSVNVGDLCGSELLIDFKTLIKNDTSTPSRVIIVANLPPLLFHSNDEKVAFESMVKQIDPLAQFQYLSSFKRSRIELTTTEFATECYEYLNEYRLSGQKIRCYYVQPTMDSCHHQYLDLPPREKLFLISPPASPPVGWEVQLEKKPVINYELLAAISKIGKSDSYEVFTGNDSQPSIIIHVCEDPPNFEKRPANIVQTRCPDRKAERT